jgi:hypothetical protein
MASPVKLHENVPVGSKVINGGQTDRWKGRQHGDLISLTFLFDESWLKRKK